jgi:hypothetical protein
MLAQNPILETDAEHGPAFLGGTARDDLDGNRETPGKSSNSSNSDDFDGRDRDTAIPDIVIPEVIAQKSGRGWNVTLNPAVMPKLRINDLYANAIRQQLDTLDRASPGLKARLYEARWFVKNIQQRFDTIRLVAQAIVERQKNFFAHGPIAIELLALREISEELGLHESTISRVTTGKYMDTPYGTFELKYFLAGFPHPELPSPPLRKRVSFDAWIYLATNKDLPDLIKIGHSASFPSPLPMDLLNFSSRGEWDLVYISGSVRAESDKQDVLESLSHCRVGRDWLRCSVEECIRAIDDTVARSYSGYHRPPNLPDS